MIACKNKWITRLLLLIQISTTNSMYSAEKVEQSALFQDRFISFNYDNEELVNIVSTIAAYKGINILFPQGANAIKSKVTLQLEQKFTIEEAWDFLFTIVRTAGYTIVPKGDFYTIAKIDAELPRNTVKYYIGTPLGKLPDSDEVVGYLHYLTNLKLSEENIAGFESVLKELLPTGSFIKSDATTNAILLVAPSHNIHGAMAIINELDKAGFKEKMAFIRLRHASARTVADMFNQSILKSNTPLGRYHLGARKETTASYFSFHTKIIPEERSNSLIVLGRSDAIERIKEFIVQHIDVELDSGKSILHIYRLQYLNAEQLKPVLESIIQSSRTGGTGQSAAAAAASTERFFDEVIIQTDTKAGGDGKGVGDYYGGNNLIIAARDDDWKKIKKLLEELDVPSRLVFIQVVIADLTLKDSRFLGSIFRNPSKIPLPNGMEFQASHLAPGILADSTDSPQTIGVLTRQDGTKVIDDLLRNNSVTNTAPPTQSDSGTTTIAGVTTPGSTVLSFSDNTGETWGILQLLKLFGHTKIIAHPHVITTHNQRTFISSGTSRLLQADAVTGSGGVTERQNKEIKAKLEIEIIPRISSAEKVSLQVRIDINEFIEGSDARITRHLETVAIVDNEGILSVGGLIRSNASRSINSTPILNYIPVLGRFFGSRQGDLEQTNLTVFISPTIIEPRIRKGVDLYTQDYARTAIKDSQHNNLFGGLQDPVTRWFFQNESTTCENIDSFLRKSDANKGLADSCTIETYREKRNSAAKERATERIKMHAEKEKNPFSRASRRKKTAHAQSQVACCA